MKIFNRFMAGLASGIMIVGTINVYAQDNINTLPIIPVDLMKDSVNDVSDIIQKITDDIDIQPVETEPSYVYVEEPAYSQVYYSEPVYQEDLTLTYDEFMSMYQDLVQEDVPEAVVDTGIEQAAYDEALAGYNAALAEYEAASQMIETAKEVEVDIVEEVTDEDGNVTEVTRTEIQTVTELIPAGDIDIAKANLDAASAALDFALQALETAKSQPVVVEDTQLDKITPISTAAVETESVQQVIIEDVVNQTEEVTYNKSGKCGDTLYYNIDIKGVCTIIGAGEMYSKAFENNTDITVVTMKPGITYIKDEAFAYCTNLKTVVIPDTVERMGIRIFSETAIENIVIPGTVTYFYRTFEDCHSVVSITLNEGADYISADTFQNCYNLKTLTIPNTIRRIVDNNTFDNCYSLKDVYYQGTKEEWDTKIAFPFDSSVTIHYTDGDLPFKDVYTDDWYYSTVKQCYQTGLISGTSSTTFSPAQNMTRAMVVTILWRMEGQPKVSFNNKFKDVSSSQWYATSISWAANTDVVHGYGDGTFKPDAAVTREQVAVILANYAQYKKKYVPGTKKLNTYPDGSQVSTYAQAGMKWALTNGIISGDGAGYLHPKKSATRAEGAAMLLRMKNWL